MEEILLTRLQHPYLPSSGLMHLDRYVVYNLCLGPNEGTVYVVLSEEVPRGYEASGYDKIREVLRGSMYENYNIEFVDENKYSIKYE